MSKKTVFALLVFCSIWAVLEFAFDVDFRGAASLWLLLLYVVSYFLVHLISKKDQQQIQEDHKFKDWPTSGPIGHFGQKGLKFVFFATGLLTFLNPFQLFQIVQQALGNFWLQIHPKNDIDDPEQYSSPIQYKLPFAPEEEWLVYNGGVTKYSSHSWQVLTQRFAYDFVISNHTQRRHAGKGTFLTDYYCFGKPITAVADGTVIKVKNNQPNAPFVGYGVLDFVHRSFTGNYIIIQHAPNEYAFYAHLNPYSVTVKRGDFVVQGQHIGNCGHSGYSSEPHLHFHLQDGPSFFFSRGLPIKFSNITVNGITAKKTYITAGDKVKNS
ncbi:MAG: hypothetical protein Tsb004_31360 [Allomuricauda sp.]